MGKSSIVWIIAGILLGSVLIFSGCAAETVVETDITEKYPALTGSAPDEDTVADEKTDISVDEVTETNVNKAPDFTLVGLDGETYTLSRLEGSPVLLNFWATWCGPCRSEMPHLDEVYAEWKDKGLVMLAVNVGESESKVSEYIEKYGYGFPVVLDPTNDGASKYRIAAIPTTYFIDENGIIQDKVTGAFPNREIIEEYLNRLIK